MQHAEPSADRSRLVIVGNGMVGQKLVDELIALNATTTWSVTVVGDEPRVAYDRVALSSWFDGASEDDLCLVDVEGTEQAGIEYRTGVAVTAIDRPAQQLELDDGTALPYDHLVLATGSRPFVPPIPGKDLPGVFVYRTIEDLQAIDAWSQQPSVRVGVVIGGGLLGLEAANALLNLGLETHVVEMAPHLMPQQLNAGAAAMLEQHITALGIKTHASRATAELAGSTETIERLEFNDDTSLGADIVVFSAGIRPRDELGRASDLACGERGGIVVDDELLTSDFAISAIGEVALHAGKIHGLVAPGYDMARIVAERLCRSHQLNGATPSLFGGGDGAAKLKLLGVDVASFGTKPASDDATVRSLLYADPIDGIHRELFVSEADNTLTGGILVGDASRYQLLRMMANGEVDTPANVAALVVPESLSPPDASAMGTLPDATQVCTCNDVSAGDLRTAVHDGLHTVAEVKMCTEAGTSCAGCVPMVKTIVEQALADQGIAVDTSLCEHFAHTRQELFDLVRYHQHQTWAAVVGAHGTGWGCEICKPAVASMLASLSNGYVLDGDQGAVQDTNDHALANMQRNGTYSVVPRVPGGEITPAQLIALGEIATDFSLYSKITGAQRIDLFGAQLHELPLIWQRVIDAGLESGHAYGKALRTVKSCVGTTWCRYGVQDSVSMAIRLELRYRGLRSPHKLKSAVSGCTRECAEAQSKDFGVIATETGWNLYLGGNGGKTPRHAELFATDLDDDTLIRYLDRYLMFYIRTADRLERTAVWQQKLDGGIEYLRSVIIDDSLGIAADLEADMLRHVDTYECEWRATLDDPARIAEFIELVNAPDQTTTPVWIEARGQRVPA